MASRLYSTTRQVTRQLSSLQIATVVHPTTAALIALYVTGLILLDVRQLQTRVTRFPPSGCHDALNRLPRVMLLSTRALMAQLIRWIQRHGGKSYLCPDDVVVEKALCLPVDKGAHRPVSILYPFAPMARIHARAVLIPSLIQSLQRALTSRTVRQERDIGGY